MRLAQYKGGNNIMAMSEALKKAQMRYEGKCKCFHMRLRIDKDADIIEWLKNQPSANAKLKEMIRNEIES
jgi:hypothetical protein